LNARKSSFSFWDCEDFALKHVSVIDMCFAPCSGRRVSFDGDCGRIGVKWIMAYEFYGLDINKESAAFGFMTANRMTLFWCSTWTWCFMSMVWRFLGVSLYFQKSSTCRNYRYSNLAPLRKFWVLLRRSQWPRLRETKLFIVEGAARYFLAVAKEETAVALALTLKIIRIRNFTFSSP
jgi:hypothetical protein